jgi:hypothetical protein
LVEFLIKHLMEEVSGAKKKVLGSLTPCKLPTPTWMDGALKQCFKVVNYFLFQSCYTLLSLQILNIHSPLG